MNLLVWLGLGLGGWYLATRPKRGFDAGFKRIQLSPGKSLVLGAKRRLGESEVYPPEPEGDYDSLMNPCGDSRLLPSGDPRVEPLDNSLWSEDRDACPGGPCDIGLDARPFNYYDRELRALLMVKGYGGRDASQFGVRTMSCDRKWNAAEGEYGPATWKLLGSKHGVHTRGSGSRREEGMGQICLIAEQGGVKVNGPHSAAMVCDNDPNSPGYGSWQPQ